MSRLSRPLALAMLAVSLTACDTIPNLTTPRETLRGEVSNAGAQTKIAVTAAVPYDFPNAEVLSVSNGKFAYPLRDDQTAFVLAAFEDENNNNKWDATEPISYNCDGCTYLKVTFDGTSWRVTEQGTSNPQTFPVSDATIVFKA